MRFYVDLDTLRLVSRPGYSNPPSNLTFRREDTVPFVVQFVEDGVVVDPGDTASQVLFSANTRGRYSQTPNLISAGPFTKSGTGTDTEFTADVSFSGDQVDAEFNLNPDLASVAMMAGFTWLNELGNQQVTTEEIIMSLTNNIYQGAGANAPIQAPAIFLPGVTSLTGGGTTALDGVLTARATVPQIYIINLNTSSQLWALVAGTEAEDAAGGIVRGDDFNASTNAKVFKRIG